MSLATTLEAECTLAVADSAQTSARAIPPDITSLEHWSGAVAGASLWAFFILYAATQALG
jgi:hypothetical protein